MQSDEHPVQTAPRLIAGDLLDGIEAIARYLGVPKRRAAWLIESKRIPTFKLGRKVAARASELDAALRAGGPGA